MAVMTFHPDKFHLVGLGLALVREIVRVHDGSITVQSGSSGGTVFDVVFKQ